MLGRSFGNVAPTYDRVRPAYAPAALDRAQTVLGLGSDARVLDLAAGTGRLTHELARRFAEVVAVEPDAAMRAFISDGEVLAGSAEAIPLPDSSVDAVFIGEAIHWFDARAAVRELERVLRPRGGVALLSNVWWATEPPLPDAALELLRAPYVASGRAEAVETWQQAFAQSRFEPLREESFVSETPRLDPDTLLALYSTTSSIAALDVAEREDLLARVRTHLTGEYALPIRVELTWTQLA